MLGGWVLTLSFLDETVLGGASVVSSSAISGNGCNAMRVSAIKEHKKL